MLNHLVENALDFLSRAASEVNNNLKYSVIHFYAAVELFVKARLMHEHWSLVISKRQEPDWDKFVAGDFQSVTLEDAASRLHKVAQCGLTATEMSAFKEVAKDRNKMMHFFHEAHGQEENDKIKRQVVKKQLKAWYFLHQLLIGKWKSEFSSWTEKISELDAELRKLHEFLQVVFENVQPEIEALKEKGVRFEECPSCGFGSRQHEEERNSIYESRCMVCGLVERCLSIDCPECTELITLKEEGFGDCESCQRRLEPEDIAEVLIDSGAAHVAAMEGDDSWGEGNCSDCDGYHTVVRTENDEWICASCFGVFDTLESCGWCNELNTGDMEHSYVAGCNHCDGMSGWHRDD